MLEAIQDELSWTSFRRERRIAQSNYIGIPMKFNPSSKYFDQSNHGEESWDGDTICNNKTHRAL